MRSFCERMGWKIYGEYVDTGYSGSTDRRPQLSKILNDARRRRFDAIIVWKLDRFGRSVSNFVRHMEDLCAWGVRFLTITQQIDTDQANPTSRLLMHIFAAFAEFERAMISERVKAGMKAAKYRGAKLGRKRLSLDRETIKEKAGAMRLLGKATRQIAAELGVSKGTLHRLLAA
jgi:putative DNA-invertase from lambdoid prophage Rac